MEIRGSFFGVREEIRKFKKVRMWIWCFREFISFLDIVRFFIVIFFYGVLMDIKMKDI